MMERLVNCEKLSEIELHKRAHAHAMKVITPYIFMVMAPVVGFGLALILAVLLG